MASGHKILLLDDERELLSSYGDLLRRIPAQPEVRLCSSGAHALALLESEVFTLLICDLKLPEMDGFQVLSIARQKHPQLRIVVLTGVLDESYRARAYAMGAELFWQKPVSVEEFRLFQECVDSLLRHQEHGGFRGVQSKSLVDILQFECMSRSTSTLRIFHGSLEGTIWLDNGDVIDAQTSALTGEEAFHEIFSWHSGNFEILPPDPNHVRRIHHSSQGLLLDSAQALDESQQAHSGQEGAVQSTDASALAKLARFEGVEFVMEAGPEGQHESWGLENAEGMAHWARAAQKQFSELSSTLNAGEVVQIQGSGARRHIALSSSGKKLLCVGFQHALSPMEVYKTMKEVFAKWIS